MACMNRHPDTDAAEPHLELVRLDSPLGEQVRAWHSPERWGQTASINLPRPHDLGTMARLLRHGGVLPTTASQPVQRLVLVGAGSLARTLANDLLDALGIPLVLTTPHAVDGPQLFTESGPVRWQADLCSRGLPGRVTIARSDPAETWAPGSLVVLAGDTVEVDRALLARLARRGADHVLVTSHHDRAVVGPWVGPDGEACMLCRDHWLAEHDPDYPAVLAELCRRPATPQPAVSRWASATLTAHLLRPDAGRSALSGRCEQIDLSCADVTGIRLVSHPRCTCHATAPGMLPVAA